ncbi:MAG: hypothetical protein C0622_02000 [Desulfuromonas sp.]|nr:MAG: hypothetical protein C0622_02000 [Desulfuromonas sp.]
MRRRALFLSWGLLLAGLLLGGCGTRGNTNRFTLLLDRSAAQVATRVRVASVDYDVRSARLFVVNVKPWGRFGRADLMNIKNSLAATLSPHQPRSDTAPQRIDLHLFVRSYLVGVSNTAAGVLACVTWAVVNERGELLFSEQFFLADSCSLICTVGQLKDGLHKALVRRIATRALQLAAAPDQAPPETFFLLTYTDVADAVAALPRSLASYGDPGILALPDPHIAIFGLFAPRGREEIAWEQAVPAADFSWRDYLREFYGR